MFGMLDYRAHKLYRLLSFPIVICNRIAFLIAGAIGIWIAVQFDYGFLVRFAIAYVSMEIIAALFALLYALVMWIFSAMFFWIVDVVPARGANDEEAREIVKKGRLVWLGLKLGREIENWTRDDTLAFVSATNWRARWFFELLARDEGTALTHSPCEEWSDAGTDLALFFRPADRPPFQHEVAERLDPFVGCGAAAP